MAAGFCTLVHLCVITDVKLYLLTIDGPWGYMNIWLKY